MYAIDSVGNYDAVNPKALNITLDRQAPTVSLSGDAKDQASNLTQDMWDIHVDAADPGGSGVARVEYYFDDPTQSGDAREAAPQVGCQGDGCSLAADLTVDTSDEALGSHTVSVVATDRLGNRTVVNLPVTVVDADPIPDDQFEVPAEDPIECDPAVDDPVDCSAAGAALRAAPTAGPSTTLTANGAGWGFADQITAGFNTTDFQRLPVKTIRRYVSWDLLLRDANNPITYGVGQSTSAPGYDTVCGLGTAKVTIGPADGTNNTLGVRRWLNELRVNPSIDTDPSDPTKTSANPLRYEVMFTVAATTGYKSPRTGLSEVKKCYPSAQLYKAQIQALMAKFPEVKLWSTWNEPDYTNNPLSLSQNHLEGPKMLARYWQALRSICSTPCVPASPDFTDKEAMKLRTPSGKEGPCRPASRPSTCVSPLTLFIRGVKELRDPSGKQVTLPTKWTFHPYDAGVRYATSTRTGDALRTYALTAIRQYIRQTAAAVGGGTARYWFDEVGGHANVKGYDGLRVGSARGAEALRFLINEAVASDPRITRFFAFSWVPGSFDSAFTDGAGKIRQMFCTYLVRIAATPGTCTPTAAED